VVTASRLVVSRISHLKIASQLLSSSRTFPLRLVTAGYGGGGQNSYSHQGAPSGGISKLSPLPGQEFLTVLFNIILGEYGSGAAAQGYGSGGYSSGGYGGQY
jgi:hypothetical protein